MVGRRPHEAEEALVHRFNAVGAGASGVGKVECAQRSPNGHQADEHAKVADAVNDKCLIGSGGGALSFVIKAD